MTPEQRSAENIELPFDDESERELPETESISNSRIYLEYDLKRRRYSVGLAGRPPVISMARWEVSEPFQPRGALWSECRIADISKETVETPNGPTFTLSVTHRTKSDIEVIENFFILSGGDEALMRLDINNHSHQLLRLGALMPLVIRYAEGSEAALGGKACDWSMYDLGYQSWSPAGARKLCRKPIRPWLGAARIMTFDAATPPTAPDQRFAQTMAAFRSDEGDGMLLGFVSLADQFTQVCAAVDPGAVSLGELWAQARGDGVKLETSAGFSSETLMLGLGPNAEALMRRWADLTASFSDARNSLPTPVGWCSWYYYFTRVTEKNIVDNLEAVARLAEKVPVSVVQVDDGYQKAVGDWLETNDKFPSGMKSVADAIRDAGFTPGIWLAPFFATRSSRLFRENPEWFLKDERGRPRFAGFNVTWRSKLFALDLSNPEVLRWLRNVITTVNQDWGYEFIKLDFLYAGALDGDRHNPGLTRAQTLRKGLEAIREAAPEAMLLGCGCPLGPAVGIFDLMRIGMDVGPAWRMPLARMLVGAPVEPSAETSLRNAVNRAFLHRRLWVNDPDCLLVRDRNSKLTLAEVRTLASILGLSGGMMLVSDDLTRLEPERMEILLKTLTPPRTGAAPLDSFSEEIPSVLLGPRRGDSRIVAVTNWTDRPVARNLNLDAVFGAGDRDGFHVFDFWAGKYLGAASGRFSLGIIQPHETRVLVLTLDRGAPAVVGSTVHLAQEDAALAHFDPQTGTLTVDLELKGLRRGSVFIAVPPGFRYNGFKAYDMKAAAAPRDQGAVAVEVEFTDTGRLVVGFQPA